jgi:hypothetical protein
VISFHSYWIPIWITIICMGLPGAACFARETVPFQRMAAASFLLIGMLISIIAWLVWGIA